MSNMYPTQSNGFEDSVGRRYYDEYLYSRVPDFLDLAEDYANSYGVPPNREINADYNEVHCNELSMPCQNGLRSNLDLPVLSNLEQNLIMNEPASVGDILINDSNLENLPNAHCRSIEKIKRYLMEDIPDTCPANLPILGGYGKSQSPSQFSMRSNKTDIDGEKTYLSFEDVDEVMSILSPSNGIPAVNEGTSGFISHSPTSVQTPGTNANSFLSHLLPSAETLVANENTSKTKSDIDNFSHQDLEIESTIKSNSLIIELPPKLTAPAAIPKIVDFCPQQTAINTNVKGIEIELDNSIIEVTTVSKHCDEIKTLNTKKRTTPVVKRRSNRGKNLYENILTYSTILDFKDRTCKSKKVVYYDSSDEETEDKKIKKKKVDDEDFKTSMKLPVQSNYRKKVSPTHRKPGHKNEKNRTMFINKTCEANSKFNQNSSIKLIIRNKSQVIIKSNCEDSQKVKSIKFKNNANEKPDNLKEEDSSTKHEQPPQALQPKVEKRSFDHDRVEAAKKEEQPRKKQKLNIQEYKIKKAVSINNSAAQVNKKLNHADIPGNTSQNASVCSIIATPPSSEEFGNETKDPVKQQILMKIFFPKKKKREGIPSRILKEKNLQLEPLMSDAEVIKIVDPTKPIGSEKIQLQADYEQNAVASVELNTEQNKLEEKENYKFKQKGKRDKRSPMDEKKHITIKIDNGSCKNIKSTLKSVEKQVKNKISSNIVMKKAPEKHVDRHLKLRSPVGKYDIFNTTTVRDYDAKAVVPEEDKMIEDRHRCNSPFSSAVVQTNSTPEFAMLASSQTKVIPASSRCNDGNMSLSSAVSPARPKETLKEQKQRKSNERVLKSKNIRTERLENNPKEKKMSRSKDRSYRRRSRSVSCGRENRSRSRSLSRCRDRYRTSRAKLRSRSPYYKRRSPSARNERSEIPRSHSSSHQCVRSYARFNIPLLKPKPVCHTNGVESTPKSLTPPLRKSTNSESSSSSLSSSSGSHSSSNSRNSNQCYYKRQGYTDYSSEDRQLEERRIVFVGRLERDIDKTHLRNIFSKFGVVTEVRLLRKQDGSRYGFVTYRSAHEAWLAVDSAARYPQYDINFGGRRDFYRRRYTDFDGIEAKYTEREFFGAVAPPVRRDDDNSFEQMLGEVKKAIENKKTRRIMKTDDYSSD